MSVRREAKPPPDSVTKVFVSVVIVPLATAVMTSISLYKESATFVRRRMAATHVAHAMATVVATGAIHLSVAPIHNLRRMVARRGMGAAVALGGRIVVLSLSVAIATAVVLRVVRRLVVVAAAVAVSDTGGAMVPAGRRVGIVALKYVATGRVHDGLRVT